MSVESDSGKPKWPTKAARKDAQTRNAASIALYFCPQNRQIRAIKQGRPHPQPFPSPFPRSGRRVIPPPPLETALARANPHMTAHLLPPAGSAGFWLFSISPIMSSKAFVTFSL